MEAMASISWKSSSQVSSPGYESITLTTYQDPSFDCAQPETTEPHLYRNNLSRSNKAENRIAGRGVTMSVESAVCYNCDQAGHTLRNSHMAAKNYIQRHKRNNDNKKKLDGANTGSGGGSSPANKRCSVHKSTAHDDADCHEHGAPRQQKGNAFTTITRCARTLPADCDEKPAVHFRDDSVTTSTGVSCAQRLLMDRHFRPTSAEYDATGQRRKQAVSA